MIKDCSILRNIVGRVSVQSSIDVVLRYAINILREKQKTFDGMAKKDQSVFISLVKKYHRENQKLFASVMTGRF